MKPLNLTGVGGPSGTVGGSGSATQVAFWTDPSTISGSAGLTWNGSTLTIPALNTAGFGNRLVTTNAIGQLSGMTTSISPAYTFASLITFTSGIASNGAITGSSTLDITGPVTFANLGTGSTKLVTAGALGGLSTTTASAFGLVDGTGAANQVAYWADVDTLTGSANLTFNGTNLTAANDLILSNTAAVIRNSTTDGTDNRLLLLNGGGGTGANRGAFIVLYGNEQAAGLGRLLLNAGTGATGDIQFGVTAGTAMTISNAMAVSMAGTLAVTSTITNSTLTGTGIRIVSAGATGILGVTTTFTPRYTFNGGITTVGDIEFATLNGVIRQNTASPNDTSAITLAGGGTATNSDGSYVTVYGNEHATGLGRLALVAGNGTNGDIHFTVAVGNAMTLDKTGKLFAFGDFSVTGNSTFSGTAQHTGAVGIGLAPSTASYLILRNGTFSGTSAYGGDFAPLFTSGVTSTGGALYAEFRNVNTAYTLAQGIGIQIGTPTKGGASTVSNIYGLKIENQSGGFLNSFAIHTGTGLVQFGGAVTMQSTLAVTSTVTAGIARMGSWPTDGNYAMFCHSSRTGATDYAFLQHSGGDTYINCAAGESLHFGIGGSGVAEYIGSQYISTAANGAGENDAIYRASRGTLAVPSNVANGDSLLALSAQGYSGGFYATAQINFVVDGGFTGGLRPPSRFEFFISVADSTQQLALKLESNKTLTAYGPIVGQSGLTITGTTSTTSNFITGAHLIMASSGGAIRTDTSDGSDNRSISLGGGGDVSITRGAVITLYGNEFGGANSGRLILASGNGSPGDVLILTGATTRISITSAGVYTLSGLAGTAASTTVTVTSTGVLGRTAALLVNDSTGQVFATGSGDALSAGLISESTLPFVAWHETDAAANQGWWAMGAQANQFRLVAFNDAGSTINNIMTVDRSGATPTLVTIPPAVTVGEKLTTAASTTTRAGFRLVPGTAPTTPVDGDMWYNAATNEIHIRLNGVTRRFQDLPA